VGQLCNHSGEVFAWLGAFMGKLFDGSGLRVEDHALVTMAHEPTNDIAAHAAESNHSELHHISFSILKSQDPVEIKSARNKSSWVFI
jgi:hypothetical protein